MTSNPPAKGISVCLGEHAATALEQWAADRGKRVQLALPQWTASGYTGSKLAAIQVSSRHPGGSQPEKIIVKACPPGPYSREGGRHAEAIDVSEPRFVKRHLVHMPYGPYPTRDGGLLIFQGIAGGSLLRSKPISALPENEQADACVAVVRSILNEWNGNDFKISPKPVSISLYLRNELREAFAEEGSVRRWTSVAELLDPGIRWISTAEDGAARPLVNPVLMVADESVSPVHRLAYITGHSHGDLHSENVLIPRSHDGTLKPENFRLVDLSTFDPQAPVSRDPTMLILSIISSAVATLPAGQSNALLNYLIKSDPMARASLTPLMLRTVDSIRTVESSTFFSRGFSDNWRDQYLLSLQAAGLLFTTFDDLPAKARWWFFRLAAYAATHLLSMLGQLRTQPPRFIDQSILGPTYKDSAALVQPPGTGKSASAVPGAKLAASEPSEDTASELEHWSPGRDRNLPATAQAANTVSPPNDLAAGLECGGQAPIADIAQSTPDTDLAHSATVAHAGLSYSEHTRALICTALEDDWHAISRLIDAAPTIHDGWSLWDWMESNRKLHRLRGALVALRRYDLVALLDADVLDIDDDEPSARQLARFRKASESLVGTAGDLKEAVRHATAATSPPELVALASRPRHLAYELQQAIAALPSLNQNHGYTLKWLLAWNEARSSAGFALRQLLDALPTTTEKARRAFRRMSSWPTHAENTEAAFVSLHTLLRQLQPR
jgi:hypothetical protein